MITRSDCGLNIVMRHTNINTKSLEPKMADDLAISEDEAAAVAKTPNRVTLDSMLEKIEREEYYRPIYSQHVTVAVITMRNGYVLVGKSAPADPANYDYELGRKFAKEDCVRQLWALEGYLLREQLHGKN